MNYAKPYVDTLTFKQFLNGLHRKPLNEQKKFFNLSMNEQNRLILKEKEVRHDSLYKNK